MTKSNLLLPLAAISVMAMWALCYPLISIGSQYFPPLLFASLRASISGVVLLFFGRILNRPKISGQQNWSAVIAIGLTATALGFWGMFEAGNKLPPGLATVLTNTQPLIAMTLGWWFLGEQVSRRSLSGLLTGFLGIVLVSLGSALTRGEVLLTGTTYVLIAALGVAIGNVLMKKFAIQVDVINATGWQLLIGSIPLGFVGLLIYTEIEIHFTPSFVFTLLVLSLVGTALPFVIWFWLLQKYPLYKANSFTFLTPVIGIAIGYVFFSEKFTALQLLGVTAVIAGIWIVNSHMKVSLKDEVK